MTFKTIKDVTEDSIEFEAIKALCEEKGINQRYALAFFQIYKGVGIHCIKYPPGEKAPSPSTIYLNKRKFINKNTHYEMIKFLVTYVHDYRLKNRKS